MGKILQKDARCNAIVAFHNEKLAVLKSKLASHDKSVRIYYEIPGVTASAYGSVINMGVPEVDLLGTNVLSGVPVDMEYNIEKMTIADPDWIFIVDTSYYSGDQCMGFFTKKDDSKAAATLSQYTSRNGWSDLDAVKDKHVALVYGELRHSVSSLYNAYQMANIIDKGLVSDAELAQLETDLGTVLPWKFSGYFGYVMA
jgi:ABC-type Fe3+-hydroxamate transport system substrate-binding protein